MKNTGDDITDDLKLLIKIQEIDNKLGSFELEKNIKKNEYDKIKEESDIIKKEYDSITNEQTLITASIKNLEEENTELNKKIESSRNKMFSVKSQREFDALKAEIKTAQHLISENETKQITFMETFEKLNIRIPDIETKVKEYEKQMTGLSEKVDAYLESIKEASEKYTSEKNEILHHLKQRTKQIYNKLLVAGKSPVLSRINLVKEKNKEILTCSACNIDIPPQTVIEIRKKTKICTCDSCIRILYWEE